MKLELPTLEDFSREAKDRKVKKVYLLLSVEGQEKKTISGTLTALAPGLLLITSEPFKRGVTEKELEENAKAYAEEIKKAISEVTGLKVYEGVLYEGIPNKNE